MATLEDCLTLEERALVRGITETPALRERFVFATPPLYGIGASSLILRADDPTARRAVILRVPRPPQALKEKVFREMLERRHVFDRLRDWVAEERTLAVPRVPTIYEFGTLGLPGLGHSLPYTVEQFIPGETLAARLKRGPLPLEQVVELFADLAVTLRAMHEGLGLAHLDLHPGNIMVTPDVKAYILDVGFAKAFSLNGPDTHGDWLSSTGERHSVAPEMFDQLERYGRYAVTEKGEVYALGVNLYAMLTGSFPFDAVGLENGESRRVIRELQRRVTAPFPGQRFPLLRTQLMHWRGLKPIPALQEHSDLEDVVFTMLAHEAVRYPTVKDAQDAFTRALPRRRTHNDRLVPAFYGATALFIAGLLSATVLTDNSLPSLLAARGERAARRVQEYARPQGLAALRADARAALRGELVPPAPPPREMDAAVVPVLAAYRDAREAIRRGDHAGARGILEDALRQPGLDRYERAYALPVMLAQELLLTTEPNLDRVLHLLDEGERLAQRAPLALHEGRRDLRCYVTMTRSRIFLSKGFYEQALQQADRALTLCEDERPAALRSEILEHLRTPPPR